MLNEIIDKPLSRTVPLYWLREKLFWHYYRNKVHKYDVLFKNAPLSFTNDKYLMDLVSTDIISQNLAFTGFYDSNLSKEIYSIGKESGLMVDVGANMGYFTLLFAHANPSNMIMCFEASPNVYPLLMNNIEKNKLSDRVDAKQIAISKEEDELMFNIGAKGQTGWGMFTNKQDTSSIKVEVSTLDKQFENVNYDISVLKIDIEGADTWAILGAEKLIANKRIKIIFFEKNIPNMKKLGIQLGEVESFLQDYGYKLKVLEESLTKAYIN